MTSPDREMLTVAGREVAISNPRKVLFPQAGYTKLDLARYYLAVADGALRGAGGRPNVLVRYPNGIDGEFFFQKRAPQSRPPWIEVVTLQLSVRPHAPKKSCRATPRRSSWMANLACLELHPHPVRADDLDHPDELRVDLDPVPGVEWPQIRDVAQRRPRDARRLRPRRLAEDVGLARHPRLRAHRAALDVRRGAPRRAGARARGRAARARIWRRASGGRKSATACSSTTTRTRRTARSPAPTRCGPTRRRARLGAADLGRDRRLRSGRLHAGDDAGALRADRRPPRRHRRAAVLARRAARAVGAAGARRPGRRAVAAALPASSRAKPPRVQPSSGAPRRSSTRRSIR